MNKIYLVTLAFLCSFQNIVCAGNSVKAGDQAPNFSLQGSDGKAHTLSEYLGTTVVIAWFPKAFTGG
jgi:peroxiredoxin Q/BCP